jgi:hypothetical protein
MAEEAMMQRTHDGRGAYSAARDVTMTRLPFGGAVLVNGRTLALLECAPPEAELIAALLAATGAANGSGAPPPEALERTAVRLVEGGWLVRSATAGGER